MNKSVCVVVITLLLSSTSLVWSQTDEISPEPSSSMQVEMSSSVVTSELMVSSSPTISLDVTTQRLASISSQAQAVTTTTTSSSYMISILRTSSSISTSVSSTSTSSVTAITSTTSAPQESSSANNFPLSEIKYIYIIVGIILFLILIIILLIAVVAIMCQRRIFEKKQQNKKAKKASQQQLPLAGVQVHKPSPPPPPPKPQTPVTSPARKSPKKTKPIDTVTKNGVQKTNDNNSSSMSDFPLLCRVLQDYDSSQHRQTSVSSSDALVASSPVHTNGTTVNGRPAAVHQNIPKSSSTNSKLESPLAYPDDVFTPTKQVLPTSSVQSRVRATSSDGSSEFEASWGKSTTVSYVSGCHDSHDYDELESMIEHLKAKKSGSPPRSPPKVPVKIFGGVSVLPIPFNTSPSIPMSTNTPLRKESMKRSHSADGIFDDPKYTRLSIGSSTSTQPMVTNATPTSHEVYDHLGKTGIKENTQEPLSKKRSLSTSAAREMATDRQGDYKEYMSLQQLLDIMETKIPSREASEEIEDREDQLYCPRVLRPVQV